MLQLMMMMMVIVMMMMMLMMCADNIITDRIDDNVLGVGLDPIMVNVARRQTGTVLLGLFLALIARSDGVRARGWWSHTWCVRTADDVVPVIDDGSANATGGLTGTVRDGVFAFVRSGCAHVGVGVWACLARSGHHAGQRCRGTLFRVLPYHVGHAFLLDLQSLQVHLLLQLDDVLLEALVQPLPLPLGFVIYVRQCDVSHKSTRFARVHIDVARYAFRKAALQQLVNREPMVRMALRYQRLVHHQPIAKPINDHDRQHGEKRAQ
uniref:Putative secreted protein n=1 Tax=Anopheles marajoara TaxID=58244 RepID=A0A2M4C5U4_9DIPT